MDGCSGCQSTVDLAYDYAQGDVVCRNCGLVAAERILDERPLYNAAHPGTQPVTPGVPGIDSHLKPDARTRELTAARDFLLDHLHVHPLPGVTHATICMALIIYNNYLESLGRDRAAVRDDARNRILVGSLCHAAATTSADVDTKQIGAVFDIGSVDVSMGANRISKTLEDEPMLCQVRVPSIFDMVFSYAPRLSLSRPVRCRALALARRVEAERKRVRALKSYRPASLAAGVIWRAILEGPAGDAPLPTQDAVAAVTGVSKTTFIAAERVIKARA